MTDSDLIKRLELGVKDVADILETDRPVVSRALSNERKRITKPPKGKLRPGAGPRLDRYLNLERLLALLRRFLAEKDESTSSVDANRAQSRIDCLREIISSRHPNVPSMLRPWLFPAEPVEGFQFSEAWIFSHEPLEVNYPEFRRSMSEHLRSKKKRLVYFVPSSQVASKLLAALRAAAEDLLPEVYIVVTRGVLLSPHWFVIFIPPKDRLASEQAIAGTMPAPRGSEGGWQDDLVKLPDRCFRDARDALMEAGLLSASDRFCLPKENRRTATPSDFEIFFPERTP